MSLNTLLGLRTDFSLGESAIASEDVAAIAKRLDQKHVAVADTMNVSGLIDIARATTKEGIELHIGVRVRIVDNADERNKDDNKRAWYPKVYARTAEGMRSIYALLSRATAADRFFFVPRLSIDDLLTLDPEHVVVTTGDQAGVFTRPDYHEIGTKLIRRFKDSLFLELVAIPTPYYERMNLNLLYWTDAQPDLPTIVTTPTLFDEGRYEAFNLNMAIQNRTDFRRAFTVSDPWFKEFQPRDQNELVGLVKSTIAGMRIADPTCDTEAFKHGLITGNERFLAMTPFRWEKMPIALPSLSADPAKAVMDQVKLGVRARLTVPTFGYQPTNEQISKEYLPRIAYEMGVLKTLEFCDYFLVVADLVNWSRQSSIMVGPGRGSVGGSLIAYLMGITDVDPIRFGLIFERFINPSRNDLPDADLDFMSTRREEVIRYLEGKYGEDHVAGITNYGVLGSASALKDVARVFGLDMTTFAPSKFIPSVFGKPVDLETAKKAVAEISKFATANPKIWSGALAVQDIMRSFGRHASGVIVAGVPIQDRGVVELNGDGRKVNWDMRVCEDMGLVKLDILGLSTLDTLSRCVRYVQERHGTRLDLIRIPLDDADTLKAFSMGETVGVFQFEGGAARRILKDMAQTTDVTFDDLTAANALNRPGPIEAGLVQDYIDGRNGSRLSALPHPNMTHALKDTFNVIVYQEQVMQVAVDLCGFSLSDADKLRKAMGKKLPEEMKKMRSAFMEGATRVSGMNETDSGAIFDQIEVFAGYAFNKSHAAAYSLIAYQCMWLKVHYPVEFYAAALSTVDEKKLQVLVNDASIHGVKVLPPDVNISTNEFVIGNDTTLYVPFNRIKGLSDKGGMAIIEGRNKTGIPVTTTTGRGATKVVTESIQPVVKGRFTSMEDFQSRIDRRLCNVRAVGSLDSVGAFSRVVPGQLESLDVSRRKDQMILLPGLMTGVLTADRDIPKDKFTIARLMEIVGEYEAITTKTKVGDKVMSSPIYHAKPAIGSKAKFMAVMDGPGRSEEMERMFTKGETFAYTSEALMKAGLTTKDGYWTGMVKKRKSGKVYTPSEIGDYVPFLQREIELLKPPLIITLGTTASRHFVPELKGDMMDHCGRTFYNEKLDAMILIGFNPQMCYHAPEKMDLLVTLFETARSIILPDE